jgi:hypothetical protein
MTRTLFSTATILLIAVATASATPINIVTNGGFETGDFSGWTQLGNTGFTAVAPGALHSGSYGAVFGPVGSLGYITQDLTTIPGAIYGLSFWITGTAGTGPGVISVDWNGVNEISFGNPTFGGWTNLTVPGLLASGASTPLKFGFQNDPGSFYLDDISVTTSSSAPTPEPATFGIAGSVLLGLGLLRRTTR